MYPIISKRSKSSTETQLLKCWHQKENNRTKWSNSAQELNETKRGPKTKEPIEALEAEKAEAKNDQIKQEMEDETHRCTKEIIADDKSAQEYQQDNCT